MLRTAKRFSTFSILDARSSYALSSTEVPRTVMLSSFFISLGSSSFILYSDRAFHGKVEGPFTIFILVFFFFPVPCGHSTSFSQKYRTILLEFYLPKEMLGREIFRVKLITCLCAGRQATPWLRLYELIAKERSLFGRDKSLRCNLFLSCS